MTPLTTYALDDGIATITMDDGKVNALSETMLGELAAGLDRADADDAVVILTGRGTTLSAGFDLRSEDWQAMLAAGAGVAGAPARLPPADGGGLQRQRDRDGGVPAAGRRRPHRRDRRAPHRPERGWRSA